MSTCIKLSFLGSFWSILVDMDLQTFFTNIITFFNDSLIPFILAIAFLVFIWNIAQFFIMGSTLAGDEKKGIISGRIRARQYAMYSIFAFVIILSFWGIVILLTDDLNLNSGIPVVPDYMGGRP